MTATTEFFGRAITVIVDTIAITGLHITFKIEKTLIQNPNTLDLGIYNLSDESRRGIQSSGAHVTVIAGYDGAVDTLFDGQATIISHVKSGPDWISRLQSADSAAQLRGNYVSESFAPGSSIADVLSKLAAKSGLGVGNLVDEVAKGNSRNTLTEFAKGLSVSGNVGDTINKIAKTIGKEFSVQNGAIQLSTPGRPVGDDVVNLNAETGLIGSPETAQADLPGGLPGQKYTVIKARSLIQQRLQPGRGVVLSSLYVKGFYRIEKVTFTGDTHGQPWYADLELTAVTS